MIWNQLAEKVLEGQEITNEEALSILECPDEDLLLLLHGAYQIRKRIL
jgi:biotin synthase